MSVAMLATICQMPVFKEFSSEILTPQSQEVRPRKLGHSSPSRPSNARAAKTGVEMLIQRKDIIVRGTKIFLSKFFMLNPFIYHNGIIKCGKIQQRGKHKLD